jgi:hypothetical protein
VNSYAKPLALGAGTGAAVSLLLTAARTPNAQFEVAKQGAFIGVGLVLAAILLRRIAREEP